MCIVIICGCNRTEIQKTDSTAETLVLDENNVMSEEDVTSIEGEDEGKLIDSTSIADDTFNYIVDIYEKENRDRYAKIFVQRGTKEVSTLMVENKEWGDVFPEISSIITEKDVDFDGTKDVLVNLGCFGEYGDRRYKCYLLRSLKLEYCSGFEIINNPEIFSDNRMVVGYSNVENERIIYERYEFIDDSFQNTGALDVKREDNYNSYDEIFFDIMFNREQADMKSAYEQIVDSYEKIYPTSCSYDLIYFDNDDIPELVVGMDGCFVSMYTFYEGKIYSSMHQWSYGAGGNYGYEYLEKEGIIRNFNSDYAGVAMQCTYFEMTDSHDISVKYILEEMYEDEDGNVIEDDSEINEGEKRYYHSIPKISKTLITEEEYETYAIEGEYAFLKGEYQKDEVNEYLDYLHK